jgi:hypothetical protein
MLSILLNSVVYSIVAIFRCNVNPNANGAEPESCFAFAIGSDSFVAVKGSTDVLWVHCCEFCPLATCPLSGICGCSFFATDRGAQALNCSSLPTHLIRIVKKLLGKCSPELNLVHRL